MPGRSDRMREFRAAGIREARKAYRRICGSGAPRERNAYARKTWAAFVPTKMMYPKSRGNPKISETVLRRIRLEKGIPPVSH